MSKPAPLAETLKEEYSVDFQKSILSMMYNDPAFLNMVVDVIKPEHFDEIIDSTYAHILLSFAKKFPKDRISKEIVFNEIRKLIKLKRINEEDKPGYIKTFILMSAPITSPEYIKKELRNFVRAKALENELVNAVTLYKKGEYKEIVDRITEVYSKTEVNEETLDIKVVGTIGDRMAALKDPEAYKEIEGTSTGLPALDSKLYRKGIGKGEMLVICGSPGRGKSIWLANLTVATMLHGLNTLYYTLEMAQDIVVRRIDSIVTGIPFVDHLKYASLVNSRWDTIQRKFKLGEIFLHDLPPRYLTPNMVRRHLSWYTSQGIPISKVAIDYGDIMASDKRIDDRRLEHGDVYEQIRAIGKEFDVDTLTASQANRDSLRKKSVDIDSMAEDFSKAMTADYVIGLSQTKSEETYTDEGRGTGLMRAFLAKNRNGIKGTEVEFLTDFTKMRVSMYDWDKFDMEHYGKLII